MDDLIKVSSQNILNTFMYEGNEYCLLTNSFDLEGEEFSVFYGKIEKVQGNTFFVRSIANDEEYDKVVNYFENCLELVGEVEE